jgi:hypothetical protein
MSTVEGAKGIITDGLIVYLDASNPNSYPRSGTTFNNLASNLYSGSLVGNTTYTSANNGSMNFDGNGDYISVNNINGSGISSQFTLNFWIKNTNVGGGSPTIYSGLINGIGGTGGQINRFLIKDSFNQFLLQITPLGGANTNVTSNTFTSIQNQISMCSVTYNGSLTSFYINGSSVGTSTALSGPITTGSSNSTIGWGAATTSYYFSGSIYSTQIYNRALSQSEIQQNYNAHYRKIVGLANITP